MSFPFRILEYVIKRGQIVHLAGFTIGDYNVAVGPKTYVIWGTPSIIFQSQDPWEVCQYLQAYLGCWFTSQELFIALRNAIDPWL